MGLLMTHLLSNLGAKTVVAVDTVDFRLDAAKKMRATHVVNPDREDVVAAVRNITDGRMADLVVEIVGTQSGYGQFVSEFSQASGYGTGVWRAR